MKCFIKLKRIIEDLRYPSNYADVNVVKKAQGYLEQLLSLDRDIIIEDLEKLKHIQRELYVIREIITQQKIVVKQMTDELEAGGLMSKQFQSSPDLLERRVKRAEKLDQRLRQVEALDQKARNIFRDVSTYSLTFWAFNPSSNFFLKLELSSRRKEQQVRNLQAFFAGQLSARSVQSGFVIIIFTIITTVFVSSENAVKV